MSSPAHQACLDSLRRAFGYLDENALGSVEVRQFIPQHDFKMLVDRFRELRARHAVLDWTTAFPTIYSKKSVKNLITKATLPRKCRAVEKAAEKWRKDAEHVSSLADRECQRARKERLDRFRREHPGVVFDKHLAYGSQSPTTSEFSMPRWEARSSTESNRSLPIEDVQSRAAVPWIITDVDNRSSLPSPGLSSRRSTLSDVKRPTPWLTRSPSGNSFGDNPVFPDAFRTRTTSTTH